jgi:hypothetical protein
MPACPTRREVSEARRHARWSRANSGYGRPKFDEVPQLYIDPTECIDCGPVFRSVRNGNFRADDLPEKWRAYIETNKNCVYAGKFQRDKYQKASS